MAKREKMSKNSKLSEFKGVEGVERVEGGKDAGAAPVGERVECRKLRVEGDLGTGSR